MLTEAMKFLPFVLKHLRRNWIRTLSTVVAMAICIFLFCTLQSVLAEINDLLESSSASRLVTRHAVSLVFQPATGLRRAHPGRARGQARGQHHLVRRLAARQEGGQGGGRATRPTTDWSNFFPNMAVDEPYFAMSPEFQIPPDQFQAFLEDLQGAVIGRKLADKFGWKIGDRFFLESFIPPYRKRERAVRVRGPRHLRHRQREVPGHRHQHHVLPLQVPLRRHGPRISTPAPTRSRSTTRRRRAPSARPSTPSSRTAMPRPTPRPSRPSAPASSPWPATWPSC